jgi:hypothetical protein
MNVEPLCQVLDRLLPVAVSRYQFHNLTLAEAVLMLTGMDRAVRWSPD